MLIHDWSKLLPGEYTAYLDFFYGDGHDREAKLEAFNRAWLAHQHRNPHHPQHWLLRLDSGTTQALRMPEHFAREMVADWAGAGRALTGRWELAAWYAENAAKMSLHQETRALVEQLVL